MDELEKLNAYEATGQDLQTSSMNNNIAHDANVKFHEADKDSKKGNEDSDKKNEFLWTFGGGQRRYRLALDAYRIRFAHLFDPYFALHSSLVEPLPHQISAVYDDILPKVPFRYVIADDPGAGKTIMTGLLLKEMMARGIVKRCLIVAPGGLVEQWKDELCDKFGLNFTDLFETSKNLKVALDTSNLSIASLDKLKTNGDLLKDLKKGWDLVVVDEAHKMSASKNGKKVHKSERFKLGEILTQKAKNCLFLTATPHNGKEDDFKLFMSLVDPDKFGINDKKGIDVSDSMRRLLKEELRKSDGGPLFPNRTARVVNYELSPLEKKLYEKVTSYVKEEFNLADRLRSDKRNAIGFAMTILQRRLASSPEAIYQSLKRRRERLEAILGGKGTNCQTHRNYEYDDLLSDLPSKELEEEEDEAVSQYFVHDTLSRQDKAEIESELDTLKNLEALALEVKKSGEDRKWSELRDLLDSEELISEGKREKLIIFTEHKDTLKYLKDKIGKFLGDFDAVITIDGGMTKKARKSAEEKFKNNGATSILIATYAAGEGINLQQAHFMINYDLPWNPNRMEQRFGRIHRIGQEHECYLFNLVSKDTREGLVFTCLLNKLSKEKEALGGKVFDILGSVTFEGKSLEELLIDAIRHGEESGKERKLQDEIEKALNDEELEQLVRQKKLTSDTLDDSDAKKICEQVENKDSKLTKEFVEDFFDETINTLGAQSTPKAGGYRVITPSETIEKKLGPLPKAVCFSRKGQKASKNDLQAQLLLPGSPLLTDLANFVLKNYESDFCSGSIFRDNSDFGKEPGLFLCVEEAVKDAENIIFQTARFVKLMPNGSISLVNDFSCMKFMNSKSDEKLSKDDLSAILTYIQNHTCWFSKETGKKAKDFVQKTLSEHIEKLSMQRHEILDKDDKAIQSHLKREIRDLDFEGTSSVQADKLEKKMYRLHKEIEGLESIASLPPKIVTGFIVIPKGLSDSLKAAKNNSKEKNNKEMEDVGMKAVMDVERSLGFNPLDVHTEDCGYDIRSSGDRWIEVKGRKSNADTVTITRNELQIALANPGKFILAIVQPAEEKVKITYLREPFRGETIPTTMEKSRNYDIEKLISNSMNVKEY